MTVQAPAWEHHLLQLAMGGLEPTEHAALPQVDTHHLERAYAYCAALTARHSRSFHLASGLLPQAERRAARALYAFCRVTDDLVDRGTAGGAEALQTWRGVALSERPVTGDLVALAWTDARLRYRIPFRYAEQLILGVSRDLRQARYDTFADLVEYCYGVASTVGLMTMHVVGFSGAEAIPYAVKLGVALQLTNILRDVGEDWQAGRVYLPQDELAAFALTDADIAAGRVDDRWRALMRFQIARTRQLYAEAWPGIGLLAERGRLAIAAAAELYRSILDAIEAHDYDVFRHRAHVSGGRKLARLPGIWWRVRRLEPARQLRR